MFRILFLFSITGQYLWEHILGGELQIGNSWSYGVKKLDNIEFR